MAQEALVRAYVASGSFLGLSKFSTWLLRIAYNCYIDYHRKSEINTVSVDNNQATSAISEDYADQSFRFQQLYYALDKLDEREKAVIVLHYFEDKSIKEIASILQIASGTVKYYLSTGRNHLKELLQ